MKCINVNLPAGSRRMAKMELEMICHGMGWDGDHLTGPETCNIALDDDFSV